MRARTTGEVPKVLKKQVKTAAADPASGSESEEEDEEEEKGVRRTFCLARFREPILNMMEKYYCAHPLLPGSAEPTPEGIKCLAVS
jgi:hypothetical protein